jgi:hypothetical protein
MAEKTALFAPMPSASVSTTVAVNAGVFAKERKDRRRLRRITSGLIDGTTGVFAIGYAKKIEWAVLDIPPV